MSVFIRTSVFFLILITFPANAEIPPVVYMRAPVLDPERLALANSVAAKLLPAGIYRRSISDPINPMMIGLSHEIIMRPVTDFAWETGLQLPPEDQNGPPTLKLHMLEILDPTHSERADVTMPVLDRAIAELVDQAEPRMRDALAQAYAACLTADQLVDLNRFLGTRSGAAFALAAFTVQSNPSVMIAMQDLNASITRAIPTILQEMDKATANLLKPKKAADLTENERQKIANLLGVDSSRLNSLADASH